MSDALPNGWAATSLGALCADWVTQGPPTTEPVQYIDISSIDRSTKRVGETTAVTGRDAPTRARQWVRSEDVLVSMTRPNLNAVAQVGPDLDGAVASTGFDVLRPRAVDSRLIFYRVQTNDFVADVCEGLQGVVYPAIRPHDIRRHELPLPPLPEQHRIVRAIESYFTRLDDAVATLERVQRNLKRYRASVLKAAVEGRLVPTEAELARAEDRSYEPASVLLARILAERRRRWEEAELAKMTARGKAPKDDKWKAKYVEPVAPDTSDLPELPEGWCWATMDGLLREPLRNGHSAKKAAGGNVRTLTLSAITEADFSTRNTKMTAADRQTVADLWLEPGDVFIERSNTPELVGSAALYTGAPKYAIFPDLVIRVRPVHQLLPAYVETVLHSVRVRTFLQRAAQGIAGSMPKISQETVSRIAVPVPPEVEQVRIAAQVDRLLSIGREVEAATTFSLIRLTRLRQSILKWAFEGRLVDQDPTDEPASVLLERIRAERAESTRPSPSVKRQRRRS